MKVLLTGGAGYIIGVMTDRLIAGGHQVVIYNNFSQRPRCPVIPEATLLTGDLCDQQKLASVLHEHRIEAVIHMAARVLISGSVAYPHQYYADNLAGSIALLGAIVEAGVKKVVFTSTCATYGAVDTMPITEDTPQRPISPYGETQLALEKALPWYEQAYNLRHAILRSFTVAGATEQWGEEPGPESGLIPRVLQVAMGREAAVQIFGEDYATPDGTCMRDYLHVLDFAEAHLLALRMLEQRSCIYNLGYGSGYSVAEVVEMARQVTGRPIPTERASRRPGDPPVLIASPDKAMLDLGWHPRQSELDYIIETAWHWLLAHPHGYED